MTDDYCRYPYGLTRTELLTFKRTLILSLSLLNTFFPPQLPACPEVACMKPLRNRHCLVPQLTFTENKPRKETEILLAQRHFCANVGSLQGSCLWLHLFQQSQTKAFNEHQF